MKSPKAPRVISLFSGCGGLDLGFKKAGFEIVWANDIDKHAVETYRRNLGDEIVLKDMRAVDENELPSADVLIAGFPCQPFSSAGKRRGVKDERGSLFKECFRVIDAKKPKVVLFENVRGLLSIHSGKLVKNILKLFDARGYSVRYELVNAREYGVPQNRHRLFMIAFKKGTTFSFPDKVVGKNLNLGAVLASVPKSLPNQEAMPLPPQIEKIVRFIPEGGSWKNIPTEELPERLLRIRKNIRRYKSPNFMRRFALTETAGTMTASATPENSGILHPLEDRRFTVRECAAIQSFPNDFVFYGPIREQYKQIGNAVPPLLAERLAKAIMNSLLGDSAGVERALHKKGVLFSAKPVNGARIPGSRTRR